MIVRYRYRLCPEPRHERALARVFGCARVVFNDCLRLREEAHAAGEKLSDTEVQRRVVTLAKQTPEREWLSGVASVALVQACQDARRAYRNWFESLSGQRKGRKVGHPRLRRKHGRQSVRLTRNGFCVRGERLYVAKVGEIRVRWSRPLPSVPSSVTVTREPDGRYYRTDGLLVSVLYDEPRVLLVPLDHRLAGKESVTLDDIAGEPMPRSPDPAWNAHWRVGPRPGGRPAPDGPLVDDVEDKLELIASGQAVAIVRRASVRPDLTTIARHGVEPGRECLTGPGPAGPGRPAGR